MEAFIKHVVGREVIIAGNSSGGIIALWCAANIPEYVRVIVMEDAPIFSAGMPRFRNDDKFVYNGLKHLVDKIGDVENRDLAAYFRDLKMPVSEKRSKRVPEWFVKLLFNRIRKYEEKNQEIQLRWVSSRG